YCRACAYNIVDDHFNRPRFEQVQANAYQRKKQSEDRLPQEHAVITENAAVDRHGEFRIANFRFWIELRRTDRTSTSRDSSTWLGLTICIIFLKFGFTGC